MPACGFWRVRRGVTLLFFGCFLLAALALTPLVESYTDGYAGGSGAIDQHLRNCGTVEEDKCIIKKPLCGSCHGQREEMEIQEGYQPHPQQRVRPDFIVNGDTDAGSDRGRWTYKPGETYLIEIKLPDERPIRGYNAGGFNLNASAGKLAKSSATDNTVRITGGHYTHTGSKNETYNQIVCQRPKCVGPVENETRWAGEATQTAAGASQRSWRIKWTAPPAGEHPRGAAFVATMMIPNDDGYNTCTYQQCNASMPYKSQDQWDWYGFMIPRRIMCEEGAYASFTPCREAVEKFIIPPGPAVRTDCANEDECPPGIEPSDGGGTPAPAFEVALIAALMAAWVRRPRRTQP